VGTGFLLVACVLVLLRDRRPRLAPLGLALVFAGGASNLVDRIVRGSAVDFLNVGVGPLRTGIFNVADVAITLGVVLLVLRRRGIPHEAGDLPAGEAGGEPPAPA